MPFSKLGLAKPFLQGVQAMGYGDPTPIQLRAIPAALEGRDVVASAQTGTGKTAAFAIPTLQKLAARGKCRCLVLEPTRELAMQVETAMRDFARFTDLRIGCIFGGVGYGAQKALLREGVDVLVATPGRLEDLMQQGFVRLNDIDTLVLDEVDRMLDVGFLAPMKRIISKCPKNRQTLFFSATLPPEIAELAAWALRDPVRIEIGAARSVAQIVKHGVYTVDPSRKFDLLLALLTAVDFQSAIVFTRTKHGADKIAKKLRANNHSVAVLHANRSQSQRIEALEGFKSGKYEIMVATDIAARGIDVAAVSHVVNFDIPQHPEDYVHRIGRTGRANQAGDAFTLVTPEDHKKLFAIERFIGRKIERLTLEGFQVPPNGEKPAPSPRRPEPRMDGSAGRSRRRNFRRRR
jgi:ATP-dependent RNA helicase RhlE